MYTARNLPFKPLGAALAGTLLLAACDGQPQQGPSASAAPPPQAPVVTVLTVRPEPVPLVIELPGRTTPRLIAEIRPQVTGIVKERLFEEGSEVRAGQVLYHIDPAPYQAAYDSAKANLARAEANLFAAHLKAKRYAGLEKSNAVSKQDNDEVMAVAKQAEAEVAAAKAAVASAAIDLGFTELKSPIDGRIGRSAVTPGALVTANQVTALATVQQLDSVYVDLTQSSAERLRIRRQLESARLKRAEGGAVPVKLVLEDGSLYALEGKLEFSEIFVDEGTGSVTLRAVFPNPDRELLPGMYVRARLTQGVNHDAILVPHAALIRNQRGEAQMMVVNAEDQVEARTVEAERSLADQWVVTEGLAAGDRVIVEGLQKVKPGAAVRAEEAGPSTAEPASAGTAAR